MQRLPVDISTFSKIRNLNCLYVDKTEYIYTMITRGQRYFLSRPRRFGKSLLVSTMQEILIGNKELFHKLWIYQSNYEWQKHGVIALDFSRIDANNTEMLENSLKIYLNNIAESYNINQSDNSL